MEYGLDQSHYFEEGNKKLLILSFQFLFLGHLIQFIIDQSKFQAIVTK